MTPPFDIQADGMTDGDIVARQKLDCRNRGRCLRTAIDRRQVAFCCTQEDGSTCPEYRQMSIREHDEDLLPLLRLVGIIVNPSRRVKH